VMSEAIHNRARDPVTHTAGPIHEFSVTLSCGVRVVGHDRSGDWSVTIFAGDGRLLGCGSAGTRLHALEQAGLSSDDAGEVLGRAGI
jgi:hypothetical protein